MTKIEDARKAFIGDILDSTDWEFPSLVRHEAFTESVALEAAAKDLLFAVEQFKAAINGLDHVDEIVSSPEELTNLIIDYEQSSVGEYAARIMAEAVAEAGK